jgi:Fungal specific transcription factor domain
VLEGCGQCKKAKRVCPGYRKEGDLIFRDESSNVVHKFKAKEAREAKKRASTSPAADIIAPQDNAGLDSPETSLEIVQQQDSPLFVEYALAPTLEDRATGFFVFHYVIGPDGPSKGYLSNMVDLAREQTLEDSLMTAMKAVGLAAYAHTARAPSLLQNARYQYMKAIQLTNAALRSSEDVTKDSTLMAIQILSIFETVTGCIRRSFKDWSEHLNGAAAVIKLRGPDQVKTRSGRQMLIQLTASLMITCLQGRTKLPDYIREYVNAAIAEVKTTEPTLVVQECMMRYNDLAADLRDKVITNPETIISKCLEIDGFLLPIVTDPPPGWEFETVFTDVESDFVYNGRYGIYYDYWIAQMWNALRTLRAMLNEEIRDTLLAGFSPKPPRFTEPQYAAQFQTSTETLYQIQDEILGTVVQHMGRPHSKDPSPLGRDTIVDGLPPTPMSGGAFLMVCNFRTVYSLTRAQSRKKNFVSGILRQ